MYLGIPSVFQCSGIHKIGTLSLYYRSQSSGLHSSGQLSLVQRHRYITYLEIKGIQARVKVTGKHRSTQ
jgi:hypothetical protein